MCASPAPAGGAPTGAPTRTSARGAPGVRMWTVSREALRASKLAEIKAYEAEIQEAAHAALREWLPEVRDAVLYGEVPVVAAAGDRALLISAAAAELARQGFAKVKKAVLAAVRKVWMRSYEAQNALNGA